MDPQAKPGAQDEALSEAMDRLWNRFLPEIRERVAIIETALAAMTTGKSTKTQRGNAEAAAHKLAGTLGTFKLMHGTVLARELEACFNLEGDAIDRRYAAGLVAELRAVIESKKPSL
jgi:HPt (histidine-containing phosphotransfer) domain-containing protein